MRIEFLCRLVRQGGLGEFESIFFIDITQSRSYEMVIFRHIGTVCLSGISLQRTIYE